MGDAARVPAFQLLQRLSEVLEGRAVDELDLDAGRERRNEPWNAVDDQARLALAFAQRVLRPLPLVDVRQQHAPANDAPARIAQRKTAVLEPQIGAVRPPETLQDLVGAARRDRFAEG